MKNQGPIGTDGIVGVAANLSLLLIFSGSLCLNAVGVSLRPINVLTESARLRQLPRSPTTRISQTVQTQGTLESAPVSFNQAQTATQNKNEQPRPVKRISPIDAIRKHMQRLGYGIDESKSRPDMIVSNYSDAKKGKVTIVIVYDKRKEVVGFYVYNFGNVDKAADPGALNKYLLAANDEIIIGGLFVDKEGDIGYKYVSAVSQLSIASFEVIYVTMAGVALERRPQIRRLIETGKTEEGQRDNDAHVNQARLQH